MKNYLLSIGALALFSLSHSCIHAQAGFLDPTFGTDGTAFLDNPNPAIGYCTAIALTPDGKIVATGYINTRGTGSASVIRFTSNGELDNSFGVRGVQDSVSGGVIATQTDGKILVDGHIYGLNRITANGQFDEDFIPTPYSDISTFLCNDLLVQPDGKILRAGNVLIGNSTYILHRYLSDGAPDKSFGAQGSVNTNFPEAGEYLRDILLQPDGKIIAIGGYSRLPIPGTCWWLAITPMERWTTVMEPMV